MRGRALSGYGRARGSSCGPPPYNRGRGGFLESNLDEDEEDVNEGPMLDMTKKVSPHTHAYFKL